MKDASTDPLAAWRTPPYMSAGPALDLRCPTCDRRLTSIVFGAGTMSITGSVVRGDGRAHRRGTRLPKIVPGPRGSRPAATVYEQAEGRWRIFCEHKQASRGDLDRTVTAATLERLYVAALAQGLSAVVLHP